MGNALARVLRLWLVLLSEQLLLLPVTCILYVLTDLRMMGLFIALYLLIDLFAMLAREFLPKRVRPWILTIGILLSTGLVIWLSPNLFFRIITPFLLTALLWHAVHMVEAGNPGAFFTSFILLGFFLYPLVTWVFLKSSRFLDMVPILAVTGTVGILLSLILINRQQIRDAGTILERKLHLPSTLLRKNGLYVGIFIILAVVGAAWEFFGRLIVSLFSLFGLLIAGLIRFLASLAPAAEPSQGSPPAGDAPLEMLPAGEATPLWMEILQTVILVIVAIVCLVLLIRLLVKVVRKLVPFMKRAYAFIMEWIRLFFLGSHQQAGADPGFVDEVESLLRQNETAFSAARRWLADRMEREPGYGTMKTDRERVRWLYRNLVRHEIRHGYEFQASATPQETLMGVAARSGRHKTLQPEQVAQVYGQVRYSPDEIGPERVRDMKKACS